MVYSIVSDIKMEKHLVCKEKFCVTGVSEKQSLGKLQLTLPRGKHFEIHAVKNGENQTNLQELLNIAVNKVAYDTFYSEPFGIIKGERVELPRTFQEIMSKNEFPLSQGPVMLPIDCLATDYWGQRPSPKSISEVLTLRTVFSHKENQGCFEWSPVSSGVSSWNQKVPTYDVRDATFSVQGAASTMDMGVVYTCEMTRCVVRCPCKICRDQRSTCKRQCGTEVCRDCSSQCTSHEIKLPRLFDSDTDHFTMVTQMMTKYLFAIPYAGIPLSCDSCTEDVQDHQVLHLVWHVRCRFCRFEMRPYEQKSVVSKIDYKLAEKIVRRNDARTCSICLCTSNDAFKRRKHEETVHEERKDLGYTCIKCGKSYTNGNALKYHEQNHHENIKYTCSLCGSQFSSERNLMKHAELKHSEKTQLHQFKCEKCNVDFSNKRNFDRHNRENHYEIKVNGDFVEDLDSLIILKCEKCDQTFKRKFDLKRHYGSAHSEIETKDYFDCPVCGKKFSRKFAVNRHIKNVHKE